VRYKLLGRSGLRVSELALGALTFGNDWGWGADRAQSRAVFDAFAAAGGNFIDTANIYSDGNSERYLGEFIGSDRDRYIVATKYSGAVGMYSATAGAGERAAVQRPLDGDIGASGNNRRNMMRSVEASLRRLNTDYIDLYQIHRPTPETDLEETLGAMSDLVAQGKVRYIGHSTYPPSLITEAQWVARDRGLHRFVTEQPPYSMLARGIEAEVLPACAKYGMGVIPWSPLSGGWLSGKYRKDADVPTPTSEARQRLVDRYDLSLPANQRKLDAADALARLADEAGKSLIEMAIAFVLDHPAVTAAIIGPRTMEQLESQLPAADRVLDGALLDRIDEIVPPGINVNPADGGWVSPALEPAARRRRPTL
jgi:aryl-alcohol dehydrogenase-like predicted oxidoreductase